MGVQAIKDYFFKITAQEQTGPAFASVNRRLRETDGLAVGLNERMGRGGRIMRDWGLAGSIASAGVVTALRDVLGLYDEQARAEAKVAQAVRQTGGAAGFTEGQLYGTASALQDVTRFGDEAILNGITAQLLTFKEITGDVFGEAQVAALDLATVLDRDLMSVSIMLGKALNEPARGVSALAEAGVSFSDTQREIIGNLAATGRIADAQRIILDEIASAYGGQAEAARDAGAGIADAWRNIWGDLKEDIGAVVADILPPMVEGLKAISGAFTNLTPDGQRTAVMFGALAVAIPPVTAALGLFVMGVSALTGPVGLALAGVAGLTAGLIALWPEKDRTTQATYLLTAALGDEITQSQLLQQVLSGDIAMSVSAAKQKLSEAQARHENVKAIIAERRALALESGEYRSLLDEIQVTQNALNALGNPHRDHASPRNAEQFEAMQQRMVELRKRQQDLLKVDAESADQLKRTQENIAELEAAIANASDGMVAFGNGMVVPIEAAERLRETIAGSGSGGGAAGLTGAIKELEVETESYANSEGWQTIKDNMKALLFEGQSWADTWGNLFGGVVDRLFDMAFSPAWDALFSNLQSYLSMGGGGAGAGGLFGGLMGTASGWVGSVLGLDTGGDVQVSGKAGVDRNLTVLRTSDTEQVSVRRQGEAHGAGSPVVVHIHTPNPQAFQASRAQIGHQLGRAVAAGQRSA